MNKIVTTRDLLNNNGFNINYLTAGNTVTYKYSAKVDGITELQTGTYIFNDEHYYKVSPEFEIAVTVLGTIVNIRGNRVYTVDVGLKAATNDNGIPTFKDYPKTKIRVLTEEHSIIRAAPKDEFELGQKVEIYPSHICTTTNLYDFFTVVKDGEVIGKWDITARGKNY
jgi:D-serine deaminase-like pyridoxal phosphate-dependent protein